MAQQEHCPVSRAPLKKAKQAWRLSIQGEPLFVCCSHCVKKLSRNPALYVDKGGRLIR